MTTEQRTKEILALALQARDKVEAARKAWALYVARRAASGETTVSGEEHQAQSDLERLKRDEAQEWAFLGRYIGLTPTALAAVQAWADT